MSWDESDRAARRRQEMAEGRRRTLEILRVIFNIKGNSIREIMGRCRNLTERQVEKLRAPSGSGEEGGA